MKLRPSLIFMPAGDQTGKKLRTAQVEIHKQKTHIHIHKHKHAFTNTVTNPFFFMMKVHQSGKKLSGAQEKIQRAASLSRYS